MCRWLRAPLLFDVRRCSRKGGDTTSASATRFALGLERCRADGEHLDGWAGVASVIARAAEGAFDVKAIEVQGELLLRRRGATTHLAVDGPRVCLQNLQPAVSGGFEL